MKLLGISAVFLLVALGSTTAFATDKAACVAAASKSQQLRDAHKLVEAREQLRICTSSDCPSVVQSDCVGWLTDVERALPTVVVTAKSGSGRDLFELKITVDGQPLVTKLDGQAVAMNAGLHTFHAEAPDGTAVDQQALVREGGKDQPVQLLVGPVRPLPPMSAQPLPGGDVSTPSGTSSASPLRTLGWTSAALGVAGLAVGTVFSIVEVTNKSSHCTNDVCDPGSTSGIRTDALVANIGWVAGGALLAGGAALVLFAPKPESTTAASVKVAPTFSSSGGGLTFGGKF